MLSLLTECTVLMLKAIYELYRIQRITYHEFCDFTECKLQFLVENWNTIATESEKLVAMDILNKCTSLLSQDGNSSVQQMFPSNVDIVQ